MRYFYCRTANRNKKNSPQTQLTAGVNLSDTEKLSIQILHKFPPNILYRTQKTIVF